MLQASGLYMLATIGVRLASFVLVPIVTRHLTTADYGALDLLEQVSTILSVLLGVNFASALGYFYYEADAVKPRVVGTTLAGSLMLGTFAAAVGFIFAAPISRSVFHSEDYVIYLQLVFAGMPASFLLEAGLGWLRVENRTILYTSAVMLRISLILIGTLTLILAFHLKIGGVLGANLIAVTVVALVVGCVALYFHGPAFNPVLFKRMLRYAVPLTLSAFAMFIVHFGDRFVLPRYRPFADLGIYAAAYKFGMLLSTIQTSFQYYWGAQVFQILKRPDAKEVFARTFTYWMLVLSFCSIVLLVASPPMLHLLMPPAYFSALRLVPIILLAYYVRALGDYFIFVFLANGLPSYEATCTWITAVFSIGVYFLIIPRYGITGAAVATLLTFLLAGVISTVWSYRVWQYQLDLVRIGKLLAVTAGLTAVHFMIPSMSVMMDIAKGTVLVLAFPVLLALCRFPTTGESELIHSVVRRVLPSRFETFLG